MPSSVLLAAVWHRLGRAPLLICIAIGALAGDILARTEAIPPTLAAAAAGVAVLMLPCRDSALRRVATAVLALVCGITAAGRVYRPDFPPDHVALAPMGVPLGIEGILADDPEANGDRTRLWLSATQIDDGGWRPARGIVLLTVQDIERTWRANDRVRALVRLRRPRNFGNPGEFDGEGYWARRGVYVTGFAATDADFEYVDHAPGGGEWLATEWLTRWRRGVGALFRRILPEPQAGVLSALIIGTEAALPPEVRRAFSRAGVSHVLSISGLHVALVAAAGYAIFRWLLARSRWLLLTTNVPKCATALSALPVLFYAGIAGSNVATSRSVIMILVFVTAVLVDRQRHLIVSLALAAILILLWSPGAGRDISFQLSFTAVLGLVLGIERFWPWWRETEDRRLLRLRGWRGRWQRPLAVYIVVSVSALASTLPLTAFHFNQLSLVAPFANALVVPLLGSLAVGLGLLAAMLYAISEPLAQICVVLAGPCIGAGLWLVDAFSALPYAAIRVVTPSLLELTLLYAALLALVMLSGRYRVLALVVLALPAFVDGAWWYADRYRRPAMHVTFLSVGQGDSAVVELPRSEVMVIDGGGLGNDRFDVGERIIAPFLWSRKIAHVDYLVLSHPQWDHYGGLGFLAAQFSPREFWSNGRAAQSERFEQLQQALVQNGVARLSLHRGERRRLGSVDVRIEGPPAGTEYLNVNDQSLVVSLWFGGRGLLFTGDMGWAEEADVVAHADGSLGSAVLKVPHHGSNSSSTPLFVDAVAPELAVISTGFQNSFQLPHPDVLRRYAARHCSVARTDRDGAIEIVIAGDGSMAVRTHRGGHW